MKRTVILLFGVFAYSVFFATFLYLIAFVGNLQHTGLAPWLSDLVPHSIDDGRPTGPLALAVLINFGLVLLFGMQHSIMARTGFKAWLKTLLPAPAERSVYVLLASAMLILLFWQWRPIPEIVWSAQSAVGIAVGWTVFAVGFGMVLLTTFLIDHFDLFGLKQVWRHFVGRTPSHPKFVTPLFYRVVRHPLYLGFILAFWGGPTMTVGGLIFAAAMTSYILVAIRLEEKDLVRMLGSQYQHYREEVPMLVPAVKGSRTLRARRPAG